MEAFILEYRVLRILAVSLALSACVQSIARAQTAVWGQAAQTARPGAPYVPTPQVVVNQMLRLARVGQADYVMDLGSGDGVIVLTAARDLQARGMGIEIDPELVRLATHEAEKLGLSERVNFKVMDVFKADLSRATVVTLYLLPGMMMNLRRKIFEELRAGARVVSHDYHFGDWQADDHVTFEVPEKEKITGIPSATLYLWTIPAKVGGIWQISVEGSAQQYEVEFTQNFHIANGTLLDADGLGVSNVSVKGEIIAFSIWNGSTRHQYRGRVRGGAMSGTVNLDGRAGRWRAVRANTFE